MSEPIQGSKLSPALQARVLRMYANRWTYENAASLKHWTQHPTNALISDAEWLRTHAFYVTLTGALDRRVTHCEPYYA